MEEVKALLRRDAINRLPRKWRMASTAATLEWPRFRDYSEHRIITEAGSFRVKITGVKG